VSISRSNTENESVELQTLELKIARSENLSVLPQVVSTVLKMADDPNASPRMIEQIVQRDPAITAKILRVANSSFYGVAQVPSIGRAISVLGLNTMKSLVIAVAYQQAIGTKEQAVKFNKLEFWRHSLAVATGSRILAKLTMPLRSEELHAAGMLHDVGILAMDKFCPEVLDRGIEAAKKESIPLDMALQSIAGFDGSDVGALLAQKWGLSPMIYSAIRNIHEPMAEPDQAKTCSIVAAANSIAYRIQFHNGSSFPDRGFDEYILEEAGVPAEQYDAIGGVVSAEVAKAEIAFQIR
jgi:HD-like signal output (HDOD) protein